MKNLTANVQCQNLYNDLNSIKVTGRNTTNNLRVIGNSEDSKLIYTRINKDVIQISRKSTGINIPGGEFDFEVDYKELYDGLTDLKDIGNDINSCEITPETIQINNDYLTYTVDTLNRNYDSISVKPENTATIIIDKSDVKNFISDLKSLLKFAVKDEYQLPTLKCVQLKVNGDQAQFNSIDGFRVMRSLYIVNNSTNDFNLNIAPELIESLISIVRNNSKSDLTIQFSYDSNNIKITVNDIEITGRNKDGNFFDTDSIFPEELNYTVNLETKKLSKVTKSILKNKQKNNLARFEIKDNKITISDNKVKATFDTDCKDSLLTGFNTSYIKDCLENIKSDSIELKFENEVSPMQINDRNNVYLVLPIRINE